MGDASSIRTDEIDADFDDQLGEQPAASANETETTLDMDGCCCQCFNATQGAFRCPDCGRPIHLQCGVPVGTSSTEADGFSVLCRLCDETRVGHDIRISVNGSLEKQAVRMISDSAKKFKKVGVGSCVALPIPELDRAKADHRNLIAVVLEENDNFYKLGTKHGKIERLYMRTEFEPCKENIFLSVADVPEVEMSLRAHAQAESADGSQVPISCNCSKSKCGSGSCKCRKQNPARLCNSKCHASSSCLNK